MINLKSRLCFKHTRDFFVQRIIARKFFFNCSSYRVKFTSPKNSVLYESCDIYNKTVEEYENTPLMSNQDILDILVIEHGWDTEKEEFYQTYFEKISDLKIQLYNNYLNTDAQESIRDEIASKKSRFEELYGIRSQYNQYTIEGIASTQKMIFLLDKCCTINGERATKFVRDKQLLVSYYDNCISDELYRDLIVNEPWATLWALSSKDSEMFGVPATKLTEEQQRIMSWARIYDNIRESPDMNDLSILDDQDVVDGFLASQRKKNERTKYSNIGESRIRSSKVAKCKEVFIFAKSKGQGLNKDIEKIQKMNSEQSAFEMKMRMAQLNKAGKIEIGYNGPMQ